MRKTLLSIGLALVFCYALPADACEKCSFYIDYQSGNQCKYCVLDTSCGYFKCSIVQYDNWESCGDAYDADGGDQCFTQYGVDHHSCGPDLQMVVKTPMRRPEWRLVRVRVEKQPSVARGDRRRKS